MDTSMLPLGAPYCAACGYDLTGCDDSSRCPECGRPLVEVLARRGSGVLVGKRYRSKMRAFGLPVIDIAMGPHGDEKRGKAKGVVAIGDEATGVVAIGGFARGGIAIGGTAIGVISCGGASVGLLSAVGGATVGGVATGGFAIGGIATGGGAFGGIATGGGAFGWVVRGGGAFGSHAIAPGRGADPFAVQVFTALDWLLGPATGISLANWIQPAGVQLGLLVVLGSLIAAWAYYRDRSGLVDAFGPGA